MATAANALVIMAKAPEPGRVKTRLAPPLSLKEAAELAHALLVDQLENLKQLASSEVFVAYTPSEAIAFFEAMVPEGFSCFAQEGETLGERMSEAFRHLFAKGFKSVLLIGSDLPPIPLEFFEQAYDALERPDCDVVLGPSRDGGYYLVGMDRLVPEIFEGMIWSRDDVLARTLEKLDELGVKHELLPTWYDIDTPDDLARLQSLHDSQQSLMKNTLTLLQELRQRGKV